ncbi:MupG family TIM beta-alpha barrel fold protein [Sporolactobacillus sp. CPB3-1]|uniref:MupG family TIM beta-alpha barrel fold protein n=1 Tax=Sporolactobacillus mangiferae TaxID=2940498 RepID=A0ABT0M798_9BACL|nr:MupG family TIM beta-alpha barrel fold protein [Sporolactobacillus mangiferae]MCL1630726.1 MupG family TIM beta-alpha barrel fold protein [Sporolactobacillus mangiferae]
MLGFSVYLNQPINNQQKKLETYHAHGFNLLFTSLHIPEEDSATYKERLEALGALATELNLHLTVDISADSLEVLGLPLNQATELKKMGVDTLRLDEGFTAESTAALSRQMPIVLNASNLTEAFIDLLINKGLRTDQVTACHNFYPRPETGLSRRTFRERNQLLKNHGLTTAAFFPGDADLRGPVFKGLPTLEDHRECSPFVSFLDLTQEQIDDFILGDPGMSAHALRQFAALERGIFLLSAHAQIDDSDLLHIVSSPQMNRLDEARDCIRSAESRTLHLIPSPVSPYNNGRERASGTVTVDNQLYGRYQGEIQITRRDLPADPKVNVIGRITEEDLPILSYIRGGDTFKIEWSS